MRKINMISVIMKKTVTASFVLFTSNLFAQTTPSIELTEQVFSQCVSNIKQKAETAGIDSNVIGHALDNVKLIEKVLEYDRNQPEFVQTFPAYLNKRVTQWRIDKGREMLQKHKALLNELTDKYGVPAHYLVSFWGLETNFGSYKGKMPIIDSLATLACDQRRSKFFTEELLTALKLMQRENLNKEKMLGSWAGAMGHTQFMPSAYINYAVDGDDDGLIDLWDSEPDALSSAANFLNKLGWKKGFIWGREVTLPENFDYSYAGKDSSKSLTTWSEFGVLKVNDAQIPKSDIDASLILPTGAKGPAFLVYDNFDVIMRWNNSESYALAVGYLADRIIGKPEWHKALPDLPNYPISDMVDLQNGLNELGFDVGKADGIMGPATRKGIRQFQLSKNLLADGYPDESVFTNVKEAVIDTQK
ncbi:lytic murein transglycosylase [Aliiglaciecola lipolytica]|uniref:Membrane-bound lytic murein transglycosylase B n=1 Tax=Aliiglaciecola lipolytica E3 TaxID=1127673 RepID=K6YWM2_9ALTE|nr:lytic murein transglycosylase [Aliiglaciecola lipolytica]GAC15645.1 membrane-bound lytic murein transglycosylase B [Aliiglaciecola lipolytica E3]